MWFEKSQDYWNGEYSQYWRNVVNGNLRKEDGPSGGNNFENFLEFAKLKPSMKVLDAGCGYGRLFPALFEHEVYVSGVDISKTYIEDIKKNLADHPLLENVWCGSTSSVYQENYFDRILCFSCFDCLPQEETLNAFIQSLKVGGTLTFHAKNRFYADDDEPALHAENASIQNQFPISFVDYNALRDNLESNGLSAENTFFFEKRGDLAHWKFQENQPTRFYEFLMTIKKTHAVDKLSWQQFSFEQSAVRESYRD